jgi:hypothetical protein
MQPHGFHSPTGGTQHPDPAVVGYENREAAFAAGRLKCRFEEVQSAFPQCRHGFLIVPLRSSVSLEDFTGRAEKYTMETAPPKTVPMIGLYPSEIQWIRMLVCLLRHPDPAVAELSRQAMLHLTCKAAEPAEVNA